MMAVPHFRNCGGRSRSGLAELRIYVNDLSLGRVKIGLGLLMLRNPLSSI